MIRLGINKPLRFMAVLHWVIQLNNAWGMVRESFIVPVITLASESNNLMVNQNSV